MQKFSAVKKPTVAKSKQKGFVLYEGASVLDGAPIVVIATLETSNAKTGAMVQTWILRSDIEPHLAIKTGEDSSVCGNCPQRHYSKGSCYVMTHQAPLSVYRSYKRGLYPTYSSAEHSSIMAGRALRLGAYGDPAAVPFEVFAPLVELSSVHTGYTHQIAHKAFDKRYLSVCQVSADTPKQALKYQALGAKTFRVALPDDSLYDNEIECLADSKGLQCIDCGLCDGQSKNIAIVVHGQRKNNFKSKLIQTVEVA
jgi:hypothetical protein